MASESIYAPKNLKQEPEPEIDDRRSSLEEVPPSHPCLTQPQLYISGIDRDISDRELANGIFQPFVPVRLHIDRSDASAQKVKGTVDFKTLDQAERALATIQHPQLSINDDISSDPKPNAKPRIIKQLPRGTEDVDVYDIFRPYGPVASARRIMTNPQGQYNGFRGMAVVIYYHEEDAQRAQAELHCAEVEGKAISVSIDTVRRISGQAANFSASAAPFVPATRQMNATAPAFQPPQRAPSGSESSAITPNPTSMQVPGSHLHYSTSAATYIDPRNLFCKNLDPSIDSNTLFNLFKEYGTIVSARVMRGENGVSREFGFVSFEKKEEADLALRAMNQVLIGSKMMTVRLHEPKTLRQEKLSQKFGNSYNGAQDSPVEGGPYSEANSSSMGTRSPSLERHREPSYSEVATGSSQVDRLASEVNKLAIPDALTALNGSSKPLAPVSATTSSPKVNAESSLSERDRFYNAVNALESAEPLVQDIVDLLISLPKKEKALALFNQDYLRKKVEEAKAILEIADDGEKEATPIPQTPLTKENIALASQSHISEASSRPNEVTKAYTLKDLASMPAFEIMKLAKSSQAAGLPLPKADAQVMKQTDAFIDDLQALPLTDQKQKLGDQLFKKIKSFGVKGAPKITIALLDSEDLRSLAHLMNSYPDCLREKVIFQAPR